jgi:hypothetical protein
MPDMETRDYEKSQEQMGSLPLKAVGKADRRCLNEFR